MMRFKTGAYRLRVVILIRALAAKGANAEEVESWPDPDDGTNEYFAAVESFAANEVVAQGQNQSEGSKRLRIKGRAIFVSVSDRVRLVGTGEVYAVTGVMRDVADTVVTMSRTTSQAVGQ